jgi:flagellar biosynthetic protein FliR
MEGVTNLLTAAFCFSLRIVPALSFAPPFTFLRLPASVRVLLALSLSLWILSAQPAPFLQTVQARPFIALLLPELLLGMTFAIALQLAFAALYVAGRALDIQVGFGLAQLADPALRAQLPLVGTLFAYAAAAVFFATEAPRDILAIWARSAEAIPMGAFATSDIAALSEYIGQVLVVAIAIAGIVMLVLLIADIAIALMSRTLPQMNMLVLGFQLKTIVLLATLPLAISLSGALFLRLMRMAVDAMPMLT